MAPEESTITLIGRLLRQAESTTHPEEAATFAARAQTLATRHSIDLALAQSQLAETEVRQHPEQRKIDVEGSARARAHYVRLYLAIAHANDVRCYIASNSTFLYATGFASDLNVVDALYSTLVVHMSATCTAYIKSGAHKSETYTRFDPVSGYWEVKPVHGATARADFCRSYVQRIGGRLSAAAEAEEEAATGAAAADDGQALVSTALVLREKRKELEEAHVAYGQRIGVSKGSYKGGLPDKNRSRVTSAVSEGAAAAERADLTPRSAPTGEIAQAG